MEKDDLFEMAKDPRLIPGIYNYCDRWCERCPFTARCLTYAMDGAMEQQAEEKEQAPGKRGVENEEFWDKIHDVFQMTKEMLEEMMEEQGIELDEDEMEEFEEQERLKDEEARDHDLSRASMRYAKLVDEWFESERELFEFKSEDLVHRLEMELEGDDPAGEALGIIDGVEVIRWYQYQIHIKLMRALRQEAWDEEPEDDPVQTDTNGSAKVALIGMDRSIGAWGELRSHLPGKADSILNVLLHLDRLRRQAEETFPDARAFKRPGFDDEIPVFEVE